MALTVPNNTVRSTTLQLPKNTVKPTMEPSRYRAETRVQGTSCISCTLHTEGYEQQYCPQPLLHNGHAGDMYLAWPAGCFEALFS